mmetsp:Transcript_9715/g.58940  ORF Transcript_9715/g.58940 Transcript_9715/m.58940 type:complete len:122 (+) Transcript_9715:5774-6139(+)
MLSFEATYVKYSYLLLQDNDTTPFPPCAPSNPTHALCIVGYETSLQCLAFAYHHHATEHGFDIGQVSFRAAALLFTLIACRYTVSRRWNRDEARKHVIHIQRIRLEHGSVNGLMKMNFDAC